MGRNCEEAISKCYIQWCRKGVLLHNFIYKLTPLMYFPQLPPQCYLGIEFRTTCSPTYRLHSLLLLEHDQLIIWNWERSGERRGKTLRPWYAQTQHGGYSEYSADTMEDALGIHWLWRSKYMPFYIPVILYKTEIMGCHFKNTLLVFIMVYGIWKCLELDQDQCSVIWKWHPFLLTQCLSPWSAPPSCLHRILHYTWS